MKRPVVILTALDLEYDAVRRHLTDIRPHVHHAGTRFETGRVADGTCRVVLGLVGKGNGSSAVIAERAMTEFDPPAVLFSGVAGGLWPGIALGDIVVASHVYAYHGGTSEDDGLKSRPRAWDIPHAADQIAHHLHRSGEWARRRTAGTPLPTVRFGPIAAGEVVLDSVTSAEADWIRRHYNDAVAVEMEGAAVAQVCHDYGIPFAAMRTISDRADDTAHADFPKFVSEVASRYALAILDGFMRELKTQQG